MHVLVYEHLTALECFSAAKSQSSLDPSLATEGGAMLQALLEDFAAVPSCTVHTIVADLPSSLAGIVNHPAAGFQQPSDWMHAMLRHVEAAFILAPETDGILTQLSQLVERAGKQLLGSASDATRLAGDKLACAHLWNERQVPTPETWLVDLDDWYPRLDDMPFVIKPRDGAGSVATMLIRFETDWKKSRALLQAEHPGRNWIVQPHVKGLAASAAYLVGERLTMPLLPALQTLSEYEGFQYLGGVIPLPTPFRSRARRLADAALCSMSGLRGFVGVDLVLGEDNTGHLDRVMEINPRLTTSYLGLRKMSKNNLAEAILTTCLSGTPPSIAWRSGSVGWDATGNVCLDD